MPQLLAAVGGWAAVGTFVAKVAFTVLLSKLATPFPPKNRQQQAQQSDNAREFTVRSSAYPRQIIYGEVRTAGLIAWVGCSGTNNIYLWYVIVLAGHECDAITDIWLDNQQVRDGEPSPFSGKLTVYKHLGSNGQLVNPYVDSAFPEWTNTFKGTGLAYIALRLERDSNVWYNGAPQNFFALVRGRKLYDPRLDSTAGGSGSHRNNDAGTWTWSNNAALAARDYITGGSIVYYGAPVKFYGARELDRRINEAYVIAAANKGDESCLTPIPFSSITNSSNFTHSGSNYYKTGGGSGWGTGVHSTDSITRGSVTGKYYGGSGRQIFGLHTSAALAGSGGVGLQCAYGWYFYGDNTQIQIVESGTAVHTISRAPTSTDIAEIWYDGHSVYYYLNGALIRRTAVGTDTPLYLNVSSYAVNQGFTLGVQKRYTCDVQLSDGDTHGVNLAKLESAGVKVPIAAGKYRLFALAYDTPTVEITADDVVGSIEVVTAPPQAELYNRVSGTFYDEWRNWSMNSFPTRTNSTYESEDNNETRELSPPLQLEATRTSWRAQRLAELKLKQGRHKTVVRFSKLTPKAAQIGVWDTLSVTLPEFGWDLVTFRCLEWSFNAADGFIEILAQIETSAAYTDLTVAQYLTAQTVGFSPAQVDGIDAPTNFTAQGAPNGIQFKWDNPSFISFVIELWEGTTVDAFNTSTATMIWEGKATGKFITKTDTTTRYYWIRARTADRQYGGPVPAATTGLTATGGAVTASLSASASPGSISVSTTNTSYTTVTASVSASGGTVPYTYAWTWTSGGSGITITSTTASSTTFSVATMTVGETRSGTARCRVTDNVGTTYDVYVTVSITRPAMSAICSPSTVSATDYTASITTSSVTAVPSNGGTPYSYAWTWQSGGTGISINSASSQSTTFSATGLAALETRTGTAQCVVTDTPGQSVTVTCAVSITRNQVTDTFSLYGGAYYGGEPDFALYMTGYSDNYGGYGSFGSITPNQDHNGYLILTLYDATADFGGPWAEIVIQNFVSDPGQSYFSSLRVYSAYGDVTLNTAAASYSYAAGYGTWRWTGSSFGMSDGASHTVVMTF